MMAGGCDSNDWRRLVVAAIGSVLALSAPVAAHACGACAEDKIAATYDHAVVTRAAADGDLMVYCEVVGHFDRRRLLQAAGRVHAIRADSVRISAQPAAFSFAVDRSRQSPRSAVEATQRGLRAGTRLTIIDSVKAPD